MAFTAFPDCLQTPPGGDQQQLQLQKALQPGATCRGKRKKILEEEVEKEAGEGVESLHGPSNQKTQSGGGEGGAEGGGGGTKGKKKTPSPAPPAAGPLAAAARCSATLRSTTRE